MLEFHNRSYFWIKQHTSVLLNSTAWFGVAPYPDISGVVYMDRNFGGIYAFHAAECYAFGLVLVLISRLPEGLRGAISQAANHGGAAGSFNVYYTG